MADNKPSTPPPTSPPPETPRPLTPDPGKVMTHGQDPSPDTKRLELNDGR
jgi:hypothetical protein